MVRVADKNGQVLEDHPPQSTEAISPALAYVMTSLMRSVIEDAGATGVRAHLLGRPAAGKTGTAQEQRDAWFAGYTPDLVTVAWVGFDNHDRLGREETGAHAALPVWLYYMKAAEEGRPVADFGPPPTGVEEVRIDTKTGLLSSDPTSGRLELFLQGTAPKDRAPPPGQVSPTDLPFLDDGRKR